MTTRPQRVALVTGCGKENGIGAAIARRLAADGAIVVASDARAAGVDNDNTVDRRTEWRGLDSLVSAIRAVGGEASALEGDVSTEAGAGQLVAETIARHGRLDILVNNAGAPHGQDRGEIETIPVDAWHKVMAVNALGPFLMARAAVPHMKSRGWGRIISMSSVAGMYALPQRAVYSASKAAVIGMTRSLALDLAPLGITVNAICPGSIRTDRAISTTLRAGWNDVEAGLKERAKALPMGRHGLPHEIAATVAHLASEEAGFITGQTIVIDGGGLPPHAV
ncbi:MAG: SDR family NAD(P)-dependent oxidoreductase [Hyphomicrobiaceae bacterium]|nr:SDR family NAD(P)-dependent oxidoreductase [Hyphomicrobiaceae bacterium]